MIGRSHRGFTLLETILASTIAAVVMSGAAGLFFAMSRADRVFATRFNETSQLALTQGVVRKAMLLPIISTQPARTNQTNTDADDTEAPDEERPRILLMHDTSAGSGSVALQRMEIVLSASPVPQTLAGMAAGWAHLLADDGTDLDFSSGDAESGPIRGVFELRPDNSRERIMHGLGIDSPLWNWSRRAQRESQRDMPGQQSWTLWWRPMPVREIEMLHAGTPLMVDLDGDQAWQTIRLARAVPLITGLADCQWRVFKQRERKAEYEAQSWADLPAYIELELTTGTGQFASWLFEIAWTVGEDPSGGGQLQEEEEEEVAPPPDDNRDGRDNQLDDQPRNRQDGRNNDRKPPPRGDRPPPDRPPPPPPPGGGGFQKKEGRDGKGGGG